MTRRIAIDPEQAFRTSHYSVYSDDRLSHMDAIITDVLQRGGSLREILLQADRVLEEEEATPGIEITMRLEDKNFENGESIKGTLIALNRIGDSDQRLRGTYIDNSGLRPINEPSKRTLTIRLEKDTEAFRPQTNSHSFGVGVDGTGASHSIPNRKDSLVGVEDDDVWPQSMANHHRHMDEAHRHRIDNVRQIEEMNARLRTQALASRVLPQ